MALIDRLRAIAGLGLAACGARAGEPAATVGSSASRPPMAVATQPAPLATGAPAPMLGPDGGGGVAASSAVAVGRTGTTHTVPLPDVTPPLFLDYVAVDRPRGRVWIPIGNNGTVAVFDTGSKTFARVGGFKTAEREMKGKKRLLGPSSAAVADRVVYVGDRASNQVCAVDAAALTVGPCATLASPPDGVAYVASAKEVWVTTPHDESITVLDASKDKALKFKTVIKTPGAPEGFASDDARGLFFTNLEDKGSTLVIDVPTHRVKATWNPKCSSDGPRGLAYAPAMNFLVVACTDHVQVLDAGHDGAPLGTADTGAGVDNLDYLESKQLLYAAAGKAARLSVLHLDASGQLALVTSTDTAPGARNAVADSEGNAYVAAPLSAQLVVLASP